MVTTEKSQVLKKIKKLKNTHFLIFFSKFSSIKKRKNTKPTPKSRKTIKILRKHEKPRHTQCPVVKKAAKCREEVGIRNKVGTGVSGVSSPSGWSKLWFGMERKERKSRKRRDW